ncbi:MAG: S41 family peptidase [Bacteroidota bacterium]
MRHAVLTLLIACPLAVPAGAQDFFALRKSFEVYGRVYQTLAAEYVDALDPEALMRTGIGSMTEALDPYTVFYDEATATASRLQQGGDVGGVGVIVGERAGRLVITSIADGSDAEQQGLRPGDAVVRLAGQDAETLGASRANGLLRGQPGSSVALDVEREGETEALQFVLVRTGEPPVDVVYSGRLGDPADAIGYVRLAQFRRGAADQVAEAVEALSEDGGLSGVLIDLRGNGGGLLEEAVEIVGLFVPAGTAVVQTRGRATGTDQTYVTQEPPRYPDLPVSVLVDGVSASASEILAGALQDMDRGLVVGETTFGKGLVQVVRPMPFGTALKITVSRYTTPSGREIQSLRYVQGEDASSAGDGRVFQTDAGRDVRSGVGIEPDVPVSLGPPSELEQALTRSAAFLRFANRFASETPDLPTDFRVDGDVLDRFRRFVESEGVDYRTAAERAADALAADLTSAGYDASREVEALRRAIADEKARDFDRHAERLRARLRDEILSRYVGQQAQTVAALAEDPVVTEARRLLMDPTETSRRLGR